MSKSGSKYFNTSKRMDDAFIELIDKKDFEYITVKEICKKAEVNRSTFYLHYETMEDLLSECVELQFKTLFTYFNKQYESIIDRVKNDSLDSLYFINDEYLKPYLTFIKENKRMFQVVLKHPNVFHALKTYEALYDDVLNPILERYQVPQEKRKYMVTFYIKGIMGVIGEWLSGDCKESIDDIIDIIEQCSRDNHEISHK